ncbi:MAG: UvrD-helicase domain-containing protein [Chromatiales bacterium]|nr:UvrD-helicase domain-containing protein [Chromatiales bacterium]
MTDMPADQSARVQALDPAGSFIVQAPAGSGKTGLLTQRVLKLLATVEEPEEILAITFTRKAAGEMRARIARALAAAREGQPVSSGYEASTRQLAQAVLERDRKMDWGLLQNPARLRVMTIDAFNMSILRQAPVMSGLGRVPRVTDDAEPLYRSAVMRLLETLDSDEPWVGAMSALLEHLDNRVELCAGLLGAMLSQREQWLHRLLDHEYLERASLESGLRNEVSAQLAGLREAIGSSAGAELAELARFAAANLASSDRSSTITRLQALEALPAETPECLESWQSLADLLLTEQGQWRKRLDVKLGFPREAKAEKARLGEWLHGVSDDDELAARLHRVRLLPAPAYDQWQWAAIEALRSVLPMAVASLQLVFAETGQCDHTEIALRAMLALGEERRPSDLALRLDYRISHILVDEFQDTSLLQFRILQALVRGWSPGDGRTLFLVGDPMQSIYRFREAEVGLFLQAREQGVGDIALHFLRLGVNFRSVPALITWTNDHFPAILPRREDLGAGAVPFERAAPSREGEGQVCVHELDPGHETPEGAEARLVAELAATRLKETRNGTVAILVRARNHAARLLPELRRRGLSCQAVELEPLGGRPVVQDLRALTRALVHEGDRTSWLAVLRAPFCGLGLDDLLHLAGDSPAERRLPLPVLLEQPGRRLSLSPEGRDRLERIWPVLSRARSERRRGGLRRRINAAWLALGGPAVLQTDAERADAEAFFALLDACESAGDITSLEALDDAISRLRAGPDPAGSPRLQVMTIHKAKGLEFDTVILPGLLRKPGQDRTPLLLWTERPRRQGRTDLLLAPLRPRDRAEQDPLYRLIQSLVREKDAHETGRLLYVAATRAIRRLDWVGTLSLREDGTPAPVPSGSLMAKLAVVADTRHRPSTPPGTLDPAVIDDQSGWLQRVPADWSPGDPAPSPDWPPTPPEPRRTPAPPYAWAGEAARLAGLVTHRILQRIAEEGLASWSEERIDAAAPVLRALLRTRGASGALLEDAAARCRRALACTLADADGRWLLERHAEAASELVLHSRGAWGVETRIVDRTFVTGEGTRWIVDFKTGEHRGGDLEGFIASEVERYRPQLEGYARLMARLDGRPVRMALYFPALGRLVEVPPAQSEPARPNS